MVYKFESGREMLETIQDGIDLYSPSHGIYVFLYNAAGSVAYYYINNEEARKLEACARESGEYWAGLLGPGGRICDDPSHELYDPFKCSNIEFCNQSYAYGWIETRDVLCRTSAGN